MNRKALPAGGSNAAHLGPGRASNVVTAMPCARPERPAWSEPSPKAPQSTSSLSACDRGHPVRLEQHARPVRLGRRPPRRRVTAPASRPRVAARTSRSSRSAIAGSCWAMQPPPTTTARCSRGSALRIPTGSWTPSTRVASGTRGAGLGAGAPRLAAQSRHQDRSGCGTRGRIPAVCSARTSSRSASLSGRHDGVLGGGRSPQAAAGDLPPGAAGSSASIRRTRCSSVTTSTRMCKARARWA